MRRFPWRGVRSDRSERDDLPPGSGTKGGSEDIPGTVREALPYDEAPEDPDGLRLAGTPSPRRDGEPGREEAGEEGDDVPR